MEEKWEKVAELEALLPQSTPKNPFPPQITFQSKEVIY